MLGFFRNWFPSRTAVNTTAQGEDTLAGVESPAGAEGAAAMRVTPALSAKQRPCQEINAQIRAETDKLTRLKADLSKIDGAIIEEKRNRLSHPEYQTLLEAEALEEQLLDQASRAGNLYGSAMEERQAEARIAATSDNASRARDIVEAPVIELTTKRASLQRMVVQTEQMLTSLKTNLRDLEAGKSNLDPLYQVLNNISDAQWQQKGSSFFDHSAKPVAIRTMLAMRTEDALTDLEKWTKIGEIARTAATTPDLNVLMKGLYTRIANAVSIQDCIDKVRRHVQEWPPKSEPQPQGGSGFAPQ